MGVGGVPGVELDWLGEIPTPPPLQPLECLKVCIGKDDRQGVVGTATLQVPSDVDATFSVEKACRIRNFVTGYYGGVVFRTEEEQPGAIDHRVSDFHVSPSTRTGPAKFSAMTAWTASA